MKKPARPPPSVIVETPHSPSCSFSCVSVHNYWTPSASPTAYRGRVGQGRSRNFLWYRFGCNDIRCPATVLVSGRAVSALISTALAKGGAR